LREKAIPVVSNAAKKSAASPALTPCDIFNLVHAVSPRR
jgi:hypothetical protein